MENFGELKDGRSAGLYVLRNSNGMEFSVMDYGAAIVSIVIEDARGRVRDAVLGYDDVSGYESGGSDQRRRGTQVTHDL